MKGLIASLWRRIKQRAFVGSNVELGESFHIGMWSFVSASDRLTIGKNTYVGKHCSIQCNGKIGRHVLIANNVGIVGRLDHDLRQIGVPIRSAEWVGTSTRLAQDPRNAIDVGDDVWIGFGAILLSGVRVGRGAVVAAGAVVTHDVAPYEIVAGNPARVVGMRFTPSEIERHEELLRAYE